MVKIYLVAFLSILLGFGVIPEVSAKDDSEIVVAPQFDEIDPINNELTEVKKDGKFGAIDKTGNMIVEPIYNMVSSHGDEFAVVTGTVVIEPFIDAYSRFHDGLAAFKKDGKYGFIDKAGTVVVEPEYSYVRDLSDGFDGFIEVANGRKEGFIDNTGKLIVEPMYDSIIPFSDGLAVVRKDGKTGAIDKTGKVVIEPIYDSISSIIDGMVKVRKDGKYGFLDTKGKVITEPVYDMVYPFSDGLAAVLKDSKWRFVDKNGKEVIATDYDEIGHFCQFGGHIDVGVFRDGYALVSKNDEWKIIDKTGRVVFNFQNKYTFASFISSSDILIAVRQGNKYGFIINPLHRSAEPSTSKVRFNGKEGAFEAYNIDGSNYFKLRDLAMILNKTEKNFEVGFDTTKNSIILTSKKAYTPTGGELAFSKTSASNEANLTSSRIYLDGKEIQLTAYNIDGNNFFKLRDIAQTLNFGVIWDENTNMVGIETKSVYIADR